MKQAVKKVKVVENALSSEIQTSAHALKSNDVGSQQATVVQLERNISLSRYLEACGDCV